MNRFSDRNLMTPTYQQLEFIRSRGCDEGQGYLFSRPVPAEEITILLAGIPYCLTEVAA